MEFLLDHETVCEQGHDAVLLNKKEAGTVAVTNYRLCFVSNTTKRVFELGTVPLTAIEELNDVASPELKRFLLRDQSILQVTCRDMRVLVFVFKSNKHQKMIENLKERIKPVHLEQIYAFSLKQPAGEVSNPAMRLLKEYHRLFQKWFAHSPSTRIDPQVQLQNKWWRVSELNSGYKLCKSYPPWLIIPNNISDEDLQLASTYRKRGRLPVISWFDPGSGAVLARSSQPKTKYLAKNERLVSALRTPKEYPPRKLYIVDARSRLNANANLGSGGGTELLLSYKYRDTEVVYSGIENIHVMRTSFRGLQEYVNDHGSISSNGTTLDQRDPVSSSISRNPTSAADTSKLQNWLDHIQSILANASYITAKIAFESASVLVHCSDGWDRTSQLVGLSCLQLDPYYRTFNGFQALVEKDWLGFGHKFAARMGLPTIIAKEGRQKWKSLDGESSPIMLQWVECIAHLLCMYPCAFEFSSKFLVDFMDGVLSCRFGNFLCNSELERKVADVASCPCIWKHLADLRASDTLHEHRNPFYDPEKHSGPIVPPAPALAPTLWPQFYLRWSCPLESHGGAGGSQELVKEKITACLQEKMTAELIGEPENLPDENLPATGRTIRVVGSNARKL